MCFMRLWNTQRVQIQKKKTVNAQTRAGDDFGKTGKLRVLSWEELCRFVSHRTMSIILRKEVLSLLLKKYILKVLWNDWLGIRLKNTFKD